MLVLAICQHFFLFVLVCIVINLFFSMLMVFLICLQVCSAKVPNYNEKLYNAAVALEETQKLFVQVKAFQREKETVYLKVRLYNTRNEQLCDRQSFSLLTHSSLAIWFLDLGKPLNFPQRPSSLFNGCQSAACVKLKLC